MLAALKKNHRWAIPIVLALPLVLVWYTGDAAISFLLAVFGVLAGFLVFKAELTRYIFLALTGILFFSLEIPLFGGAAISLPAEPLALLLVVTAVFLGYQYRDFLSLLLKEPIVWAALFLIAAWLISTATSTMPLVSAKYVFINLVYLIIGLLLFPILLKSGQVTLLQIIRWLLLPLAFFAVFAVFNLLPYRFNPGAAPLIGYPFFKDHTVFSATLSLFTPILLLWRTVVSSPKKIDWLPPVVGLMVLFALFISSSRAAWLALLLAGGFYLFIRLRGNLVGLFALLLAGTAVVWFYRSDIETKLLINPYTSTEVAGTLQDQALSVTNMNSDVSNQERLNRWNCALRMGLDRPITGFGPGTFQFQYFPYQHDEDMTYISVTDPFNTIVGRGGSAHSEYLLLLAESGFGGLLAWLLLQVALLLTFFKLWQGNLDQKQKNLALAVYLGVLTYSVHSLFNNYLNTVQFGISWWLLVGGMVYLKMKSNQEHRPDSHLERG